MPEPTTTETNSAPTTRGPAGGGTADVTRYRTLRAVALGQDYDAWARLYFLLDEHFVGAEALFDARVDALAPLPDGGTTTASSIACDGTTCGWRAIAESNAHANRQACEALWALREQVAGTPIEPATPARGADGGALPDMAAGTPLFNLVRRRAHHWLTRHPVGAPAPGPDAPPMDAERLAGCIAVAVCMDAGLLDAMRATLADATPAPAARAFDPHAAVEALRAARPEIEAAQRAYTAQKRHSLECNAFSGGRCDCY